MSTNSISLAERYLPILDEVYKYDSKSAVLDAANSNVRFVGGNKVELFKISTDGLGDYARNSGFATGGVTAAWESMTLAKDRGRSFLIDSMDDEETLGMSFGNLAGEFIRTKVVPEIDAYRFAKYASTSNILSATPDRVEDVTDPIGMLDDAQKAMNDEEVPVEGRVLFVSEGMYKLIKGKVTREVYNGENSISRGIETFDGMRVIRVPQNRFNTQITLYDGSTSGQTDGGYVVTAGGYKINFMIVHPSAVVQVAKHVLPRIFTPAENQTADAWKFDYRIYHDCFVEVNKVKGIYLFRSDVANT